MSLYNRHPGIGFVNRITWLLIFILGTWLVWQMIVNPPPIQLVLFGSFWSWAMASNVFFDWHVVPQVLLRWADEEGYQIVKKRSAWPWESFRATRHCQRRYRISVRDRQGCARTGLVCIMDPTYLLISVDRCTVDVLWDETDPPSKQKPACHEPKKKAEPWDRELD
ncbi:MAG: hypothetical protein U0835_04890 [Isosphaeraceae bacterium]